METLRCLATFRTRRDRASTDFLVMREHDNGLGEFNRDLLLATGRFRSRRRHPKVRTYKTREAALRAIEGLSTEVPYFPGVEARFTVLTAVQWDEFCGTWDRYLNAPVVARYSDRDVNLKTGETYRTEG